MPNSDMIILEVLGISVEKRNMSAIKDVVKEEYGRLKELADFYNHKIASLPKGSITQKKRDDRVYYYLSYRDHHKVISEYPGKEDSEKYRITVQMVAQGRRYEIKLKETRESIRQVERLIRAAE
ncbi:MAG: hypothetical protein JXA95_10500 [Spirochaetales bacterium]|nr:hypothetical protein [Spirochaetales bacterium]